MVIEFPLLSKRSCPSSSVVHEATLILFAQNWTSSVDLRLAPPCRPFPRGLDRHSQATPLPTAATPRSRHSQELPLPGCAIIFGIRTFRFPYPFSITSTRRQLIALP